MRVLTDHFGWKLLSLATAIVLWFMFVGEAEVATSMPVVVRYRNAPPTGDYDRTAHKAVYKSTRTGFAPFRALLPRPRRLDLENVHSPGEQTLSIGEDDLGLPSGRYAAPRRPFPDSREV